jgi:GNAT superfamily N-acetyltransferase
MLRGQPVIAPRPIAASEHGAVAQLWHDAWHETQAPFVPAGLTRLRTLPDFNKRLIEMGDLGRTIGPKGAPIGFCAIKDDELYQLFVSPEARGTGAAAALLKDGEDRLHHAGITQAKLDCLKENAVAIRFYEKMGWAAQGVQPAKLDTSTGPFVIDCAIFSKRLR